MKPKNSDSTNPRTKPNRAPGASPPVQSVAKVSQKANPAPASLKLSKILVPVDFSEESKKALNYGLGFARQFGATLVLLHVVEVIVYPGEIGYGSFMPPMTEETLAANAKARLETMAKEITLPTPVQTLVRLGSPFTEIVAAAKDEDLDLIVIATHGYTGLKHVLLGSTAERVVRHAPCPVLTVRVREMS